MAATGQGLQPQGPPGGMPNYPGIPNMAIGIGTNYNIVAEEQPIFVNAKQYNRILKRRESRKKQLGTDAMSVIHTKPRRAYLHESRHKHAKNRVRGVGGRFLSKAEKDALRSKDGEASDDKD